jgi:phage gp37-like protein
MAWESRGTEIGAADLVGRYGAEFVGAQLALVLERKRIEGKRDGQVYRPSSGYLLMACRGDWAGWNLPAAVAAREAAERRRVEVNARHSAASAALANQARAVVDEAAALAAAVAVVRPWAASASADDVRRVVDGVLCGSPGLVVRVVTAAARAAAPECEIKQRRAAALHRAIVERVAALVSGSVAGPRVVSVESEA